MANKQWKPNSVQCVNSWPNVTYAVTAQAYKDRDKNNIKCEVKIKLSRKIFEKQILLSIREANINIIDKLY